MKKSFLFIILLLVVSSCQTMVEQEGSFAFNIYVISNNVFIAGSYWKGASNYPLFWMNDTVISEDDFLSSVSSLSNIQASSGMYYITNNHRTVFQGGTGNPPYYLQDSVTNFLLYSDYGRVSKVYIDHGSTYLGGSIGEWVTTTTESGPHAYYQANTPCYWIDGVRTDLSTTYDSTYVTLIKVLDGDVYLVAQNSNYSSEYWINGAAYYKSGYMIFDLTKYNGVLYLAGSYGFAGTEEASYYSNDILIQLESTRSMAQSIFCESNDIYLSGGIRNNSGQYQACIWKNGVRVMLDVPTE